MRLIPKWLQRGTATKAPLPGQSVVIRPSDAQGPWTGALSGWTAREVSPHLYEAMREACPPIDAAIDRLVTLDGILRIETENDRLAAAIQDWMDNVQVNDMQHGLQTFYAGQGNEMYEQGFTVGAFHLGANDVDRLRVLDSKGVFFKRGSGQRLEAWYAAPGQRQNSRHDGTEQLERLLRNPHRGAHSISQLLGQGGYTRLNSARLIYASRAPEADNPYGTSIMRSTEFVTQILATIDNATRQVWERFGTPSFDVTYKTSNRSLGEADLEERRQRLAKNLSEAVSTKRDGNAADFVNSLGATDELQVKILGADGQVLDIEAPARHVLEQIVAKTGLPSWMLGFHWSTAERLAQRQGELALQESRTRFASRKPQLVNLISTMLRARGYTWNPGDWDLVQDLPNLQDLVAVAQAGFLEAQTELMRNNAGVAAGGATGPVQRSVTLHPDGRMELGPLQKQTTRKQADDGAEPAAENADALDAAVASAHGALAGAWRVLRAATLTALSLPTGGQKMADDVFRFDSDSLLQALLALQDDFVDAVSAGEDDGYIGQLYAAWAVGAATAATQTGTGAMEQAARVGYQQAVADQGLRQLRDTVARAYVADIIVGLSDGLYDGKNPTEVARQLRDRFQAHDYDWLRLARSEMTQAHAAGKLDQYAEMDIEQYDYVTAGDGKVSAVCRGLAAAGPYPVGQGPLPMRDSHPNCRCTVVARAGE